MTAVVLLAAASCVTQDAARDRESISTPGQPSAQLGGPLRLDRILDSPSLTGTSPSSPAWSPDGRWLAFLWNDLGLSMREVWIVAADGSGLRPAVKSAATSARQGVRSFAWLPDSTGFVALRSGALWRCDLGGEASAVAELPDRASGLDVSPDGRFASVLMAGDLWLAELESGELAQATSVGVPPLSSESIGRYSRPEVEIGPYVWGGPTYAWAPDSRMIAVHHVDRRSVRRVPFPDYLADETAPNPVRRSYPGDPNEIRRVGLLDVASGELGFVDLPDPANVRVVDFSWSPSGQLLVDQESDTAVDRWLHVVDPETGAARELWRDRRESRVYTLTGSAWHPDGERVVVLSDLGDRYGLYALGWDQRAPVLLSDPAFDVTAPPQVVAAGNAIFFQSNEPSPYERHVFRVSGDGGKPLRVTGLAGQHRGVPSPDGAHVAVLHSDDETPTELYIIDTTDGARERRITVSTPE
ncbi:MAG: DPP IV N-terminal domain-containing protein, partial [Planctomycetota bacterium]